MRLVGANNIKEHGWRWNPRAQPEYSIGPMFVAISIDATSLTDATSTENK